MAKKPKTKFRSKPLARKGRRRLVQGMVEPCAGGKVKVNETRKLPHKEKTGDSV